MAEVMQEEVWELLGKYGIQHCKDVFEKLGVAEIEDLILAEENITLLEKEGLKKVQMRAFRNMMKDEQVQRKKDEEVQRRRRHQVDSQPQSSPSGYGIQPLQGEHGSQPSSRSQSSSGNDSIVDLYKNNPIHNVEVPHECKPAIFENGSQLDFPTADVELSKPSGLAKRKAKQTNSEEVLAREVYHSIPPSVGRMPSQDLIKTDEPPGNTSAILPPRYFSEWGVIVKDTFLDFFGGNRAARLHESCVRTAECPSGTWT